MEWLTLADEKNNILGKEEKMKVHTGGLRHRGFVVFIKNSENQILIQRRCEEKYLASNLWDCSVAGHPYLGESYEDAAVRRIKDELFLDIKKENLKKITVFEYRTKEGDLIDNEMCGVFECFSDDEIEPNPEEMSEVDFVSLKELRERITNNEDEYTYWLKKSVEFL